MSHESTQMKDLIKLIESKSQTTAKYQPILSEAKKLSGLLHQLSVPKEEMRQLFKAIEEAAQTGDANRLAEVSKPMGFMTKLGAKIGASVGSSKYETKLKAGELGNTMMRDANKLRGLGITEVIPTDLWSGKTPLRTLGTQPARAALQQVLNSEEYKDLKDQPMTIDSSEFANFLLAIARRMVLNQGKVNRPAPSSAPSSAPIPEPVPRDRSAPTSVADVIATISSMTDADKDAIRRALTPATA